MGKPGNYDAMDAETVAELLGVTSRMLNNYVNKKGLPCYGDKRGKSFKWSEVLAWYVDYKNSIAPGNGNRGNAASNVVAFPSKPVTETPAAEVVVPDETYKEALTRKTSAEADLREIERAIKRREVVAAADAKIVLDRLFTNVKQKLLGIPSKLSSRLDGIKDRNQRKAILEAEMRQVCQELSQADAMTGRIPGDSDAAD